MAVAPYGSWRSPITPDSLVERVVRISDLTAAGGSLWWNESRPAEEGRQAIVRCRDDATVTDVLPSGFSARTTVHEYGGGSFLVDDTAVVFSNYEDQRLWRVDADGPARPLTPEPPEPGGRRYADGRSVPGSEWLICVRERHISEGPERPDAGGGAEGPERPDGAGVAEGPERPDGAGVAVVNDLVAVPLGGGEPVAVAGDHDFFAAPRPSPDGRQLAWLSWDHPNMPWDGTELWVADIVVHDGVIGLERAALVAGGREESVSQPRWSPQGRLHWVSDRSGWWNLYADDRAGGRALAPRPAEFSGPDWVFGQSTYAFLADGRVVAVWSQDGIDRIAVIDPASGDFDPVVTPYTVVETLQPWGSGVVMLAASPTDEAAVVELPLDGSRRILRRSRATPLDPAFVSEAQPIEYPTTGGLTAHAFFYPPANPGFDGPPGERPPLLVMSHGGPTSAASPALDLGVQFWTTRGIAVVAVNYGGSSGYGRDYRRRLDGSWGVVDVDDCVNAALHLAEAGVVDRDRLVIRGTSAGGFTVLCALVFRDAFAAGSSVYGVADLEGLVAQTHKFEARYLDRLIAPYPEALERYRERSPMYFADRVTCPVLLLQGLEDKVVPPSQSEAMVDALRERRVPFAYVTFAGEQHGFRQADTIRRAREVELSFYAQVLGFKPAGTIEDVPIENLRRWR